MLPLAADLLAARSSQLSVAGQNKMTTRDLGFVFLKLLGLSYLFSAFYQFANILFFLSAGPTEGGVSPRSLALQSFTALQFSALFAALLLFATVRWRIGCSETIHPSLSFRPSPPHG